MASIYLKDGKILTALDKDGNVAIRQCCCDCWVIESVTNGGSGYSWCLWDTTDNTNQLEKGRCYFQNNRTPSYSDFEEVAQTAANFIHIDVTGTNWADEEVTHRCYCEGDTWGGGVRGDAGGGQGPNEGEGSPTIEVEKDDDGNWTKVTVTFLYDVCLDMKAPWRATHTFTVIFRWKGATAQKKQNNA